MPTEKRSAPIALNCALLLLVFAVLCMGTYAKVSLERANGSSPKGFAKLSIEERSAQSLLPEEYKCRQLASVVALVGSPFALLFDAKPCHLPHSCQVELSLCTPCRYDSLGPDRMHLPPPAYS